MLDILRREGVYPWYYFDIQLRQILPYRVLGSAVSVVAKDQIHHSLSTMPPCKYEFISLWVCA